jgi:hypothetical protein
MDTRYPAIKAFRILSGVSAIFRAGIEAAMPLFAAWGNNGGHRFCSIENHGPVHENPVNVEMEGGSFSSQVKK